MDSRQTVLLEMGMLAQQAEIPEDERCTTCNGQGQVVVGCAFTHSIYDTCSACGGSGLKSDQQRFERARVRLEELRVQYLGKA